MKLNYWLAACDNNPANSIRAKTKKAVKAAVAEAPNSTEFSAPFKVEFDYRDGFDLASRFFKGELAETPSVSDSGDSDESTAESATT